MERVSTDGEVLIEKSGPHTHTSSNPSFFVLSLSLSSFLSMRLAKGYGYREPAATGLVPEPQSLPTCFFAANKWKNNI